MFFYIYFFNFSNYQRIVKKSFSVFTKKYETLQIFQHDDDDDNTTTNKHLLSSKSA